MNDLGLGDPVEVLHAVLEDDIPSGRTWRRGTIVGLHWTSVHIVLDEDTEQKTFVLPADTRGINWRAVPVP